MTRTSDGASCILYASDGEGPIGWVQTAADDFSAVGGSSLLPVNTWSHLALTYNGSRPGGRPARPRPMTASPTPNRLPRGDTAQDGAARVTPPE
ncbi:hypothetical protein GCM10010116_30040 [Microbispora rosea subsp. aerata]|nr:hypothetical protein [Microbispora rosea]GGO14906.1 hypothetical protein GCM10010116_30040 [Microbispora rosea subsp. aerata]GIH55617.1 hypothetical protein Mro02_25310 [Microbispora rosea subsp. aerata]GLJ86540.1 hypothetical protein GCM10017588_52780 [Microbispora rosea subsp. aerata]